MNITFVLPGYSRHPIGGYKMVFEYANRLVEDGFNIAIFFDNSEVLKKYKAPEIIKRIFIEYSTQRNPKWFDLDPRIKKISSRSKSLNSLYNKTDIVIATSARTVKICQDKFEKARKIYFIQDFEADETGESWSFSTKELYQTYSAGFTNIVISKWLKTIVDKHSKEPSVYVRNPIDTNKYRVIYPIEKRNPFVIGMLYHESERKGCKYTLQAIANVHNKYPNLRVKMFGACPPPTNLPNWFEYSENASQQQTIQIYNSISIFASGPIKEGFGLTALEAMACGSALVSSNNLGASEYAIDNKNALISPIKDSLAMEHNIIRLIEDNNLRKKIANNGVISAQAYSWKEAYAGFKKAILGEY